MVRPVSEENRAVAAEINRLLAERGWSGRELARQAGIPTATVTRKLADLTAFDVDDLVKIASALGVPLRDLLPQI